MAKLFTILKILAFVISFFAVFIPMYSEVILNPDIKINVKPIQQNDLTLAEITVKNTGFKPATNLRLTINPEYDIIEFKTVFYTEEIELYDNGPRSLIGNMERLANGQKIIISLLIDSTDLSDFGIHATHDHGSTTYYYDKKSEGQRDVLLELSIVSGIIASVAAGLSTSIIIRRYETKTQTADRGGVNLQDVSHSSVIIQTGEPQPIQSSESQSETTKDKAIRDLLKQIGKEKISNLLQEGKIIAIDTNDKEMKSWIELELAGFAPPPGKTITRKEAKEKGIIPDYRDIKGKFFVQIGDGSIEELSYPILFGNDIKSVENSIETIKKGGRAYIKHTFPKDITLVGGQSGDLEITRPELERIIHGAERRLSQYLELKLARK